jgi:hypothetical protein
MFLSRSIALSRPSLVWLGAHAQQVHQLRQQEQESDHNAEVAIRESEHEAFSIGKQFPISFADCHESDREKESHRETHSAALTESGPETRTHTRTESESDGRNEESGMWRPSIGKWLASVGLCPLSRPNRLMPDDDCDEINHPSLLRLVLYLTYTVVNDLFNRC